MWEVVCETIVWTKFRGLLGGRANPIFGGSLLGVLGEGVNPPKMACPKMKLLYYCST